MSASERRDFAVPPATGAYDDIDLGLLDRDNEDDRRILIEAEHPELHHALRSDADEVHIAGNAVNPRLHVAMHEIVANQLWADDPPEVWATAQRLTDNGYDRHEVLHMLASVSSDALYNALKDRKPADIDRMRVALADLPGSWERDRAELSHENRPNRAERRAARRDRRR